MAGKPVLLDVDAEISRLKREIQDKQSELAFLDRYRSRAVARQEQSDPDNLEPANMTRMTGQFAPKGDLTGKEAAERYLRQVGKPCRMADIHRGALQLGAQLRYGALHKMVSEDAEKERTFTKEPGRGYFGLREWKKV